MLFCDMTSPSCYPAEGLTSLSCIWANLSDSLVIERMQCQRQCVTSKEEAIEFLPWSFGTFALHMLSSINPEPSHHVVRKPKQSRWWEHVTIIWLTAPAEVPANSQHELSDMWVKSHLGDSSFQHLSQAQPLEMIVVLYHWVCSTARSN